MVSAMPSSEASGKSGGKPGKKPGRKVGSGPTHKGEGGFKSPVKRRGGTVPDKSAGDLVRLNKFIAAAGICSRREADELISAGLITVNGRSVTRLGSKVSPDDEVRYNGERIRTERKVYLLLNKPKDYVTTTDDPKERKTVMLLVRNACSERIYPVGRLDRNTTGVLLFTNDGELARKMTHPSSNKKKIYHVFLNKAVSAGDLKKLAEGVTLEDGFIQPDAISYTSSENKREIGMEIHSGRNRIVRRMFESLGYRVDKLDRVYFGGLTKKNLPRGKWRLLTEKEISRLKMNAYE
jgi:23S rRNA pseudouridine2605 synthase